MNPKKNLETGFVHYLPSVPIEPVEEPLQTSDLAMEELIRSEEEKKRKPDDNSASFWS